MDHAQVRAFAAGMLGEPVSDVEVLAGGSYNESYRIKSGASGWYVLRLAPADHRQFSSERHLMRNEFLGRAFLPHLADLIPRIVAADFSHRELDRDMMMTRWVTGTTGGNYLRTASPEQARSLWRLMGQTLKQFHRIQGTTYGRLIEPWGARWSDAVSTRLSKQINDLASIGAPHDDLARLQTAIAEQTKALDDVPCRLTHGDLIPNNLVVAAMPDGEPRIVALLDIDRLMWADPWSDWSIASTARSKSLPSQAFWEGYGQPPDDSAASLRQSIYHALALVEARLERARRFQTERVDTLVGQSAHALAEIG